MKKTIFGILLALVMSLSCVLCACAPADDKKPDEPDDPTPPPVTEATITGFDSIVSYPKQEYLPGEVFDKTGLSVKVKMSDDTTKTLFDSVFTTWTHKDEELTEDVDKITFTVPNTNPAVTFDVPVTVEIPAGSSISVDASQMAASYLTTDAVDLTKITVRYTKGGTVSVVPASDLTFWVEDEQIADPTAATFAEEGTVTVTVKYKRVYSDTFTLTIKDPTKIITPEIIEAEDCAFMLSGGEETDTPYTTKENLAHAEDLVAGTRTRLSTGASGSGAASSLAADQNGKNIYFKFTVNVPRDGEYLLKVRSQATGEEVVKGKVTVNINEEKEGDALKFVASTSDDRIGRGNQISKYFDIGADSYTAWFNMYWWSVVTIGKYQLNEGANTIRIRLPNGIGANFDYFEVTEDVEAEEVEPKLFSMRDGTRADISKYPLHLEQGRRLENMLGLSNNTGNTPENHPAKYTLIYMQLADGQSIPVCANMLSEIDYTKLGEQEVTVTVSKKDGTVMGTATFTLIIEKLAEED